MEWSVSFDPRALAELRKLDRPVQKRILRFLNERIAGQPNPRDSGKALTGDRAGFWRYRVGDYRVVCFLDEPNHTVLVLRVAHRKEAYR